MFEQSLTLSFDSQRWGKVCPVPQGDLWLSKLLIKAALRRSIEGLCNILVGCYRLDDKDDMVLIRVFGKKSEKIVDRDSERETFILLSKAGCAPPLYCTFNNGMAYSYVKGKTVDGKMVKDKKVQVLIAKEMAKLHSVRIDHHSGGDNSTPKPYLFPKMETYLNLTPEKFTDEEKQILFEQELKSKSALQQEFEMLRKRLETLDCDVVFCHNDLLLANIIFDNQTNKISFIDYEFAFHNFQAFDIGNHFSEYAGVETELDFTQYPTREYQLSWIHTYLEEYYRQTGKQTSPTVKDVERLYVQANKCALLCHFFWGLCALIQAEHSEIDFDFLRYAVSKFKEYYKRRDEFLALTEP